MSDRWEIGLGAPKLVVHLKNHSGLIWQFRWQTGNFPAGSELYLLVGSETAPARWAFTIQEDLATLTVRENIATPIPDRTPVYLMFKANPAAEPDALAVGAVKRWKAK
ncbi:DUF7264 domain-containing protein [Nocardia sp. CA-128927]|uniref:LtfC-like domain-containing protein n=1 Tax=Nocardia sp. CA-128927 TaxID=3239975 RepID=UPI003D968750